MAESLDHLSVPVEGDATLPSTLSHLSIPAEGGAVLPAGLSHISIPLAPAIWSVINLRDFYNTDRPFITASTEITNAELVDMNPTVQMRYTTPYPLTFDVGFLVANETNFEFGLDPDNIWIRLDIKYFIVVGRELNEFNEKIVMKL
jgi:hypothetical protein